MSYLIERDGYKLYILIQNMFGKEQLALTAAKTLDFEKGTK